MKKRTLLTLLLFISLGITAIADGPGPPPPPGNPGSSGGPVGAPIDGGAGILLAMGAVYAARKLYISRKEAKEGEEL